MLYQKKSPVHNYSFTGAGVDEVLLPKNVLIFFPQSVFSCSDRHILGNGTMWHNITHELWTNAKCGECSADLEPVVWIQGGTFGYINEHSNSTGNQRSPPLALMLPTPPHRNSTGSSVSGIFNNITTNGRVVWRQKQGGLCKCPLQMGRNHVEEWWKLGEKAREWFWSLSEATVWKSNDSNLKEEFKLALKKRKKKKKLTQDQEFLLKKINEQNKTMASNLKRQHKSPSEVWDLFKLLNVCSPVWIKSNGVNYNVSSNKWT